MANQKKISLTVTFECRRTDYQDTEDIVKTVNILDIYPNDKGQVEEVKKFKEFVEAARELQAENIRLNKKLGQLKEAFDEVNQNGSGKYRGNLLEAHRCKSANADKYALKAAEKIQSLMQQGITSQRILAEHLNDEGYPTAQKKSWHQATVKRVMDRAKKQGFHFSCD